MPSLSGQLSRLSALLAASLVTAAMIGMQVLIGGTRMVFSLPCYAALGAAGLLALLVRRGGRLAADRLCLGASALFFGYLLVRGWFSPVPYLARSDLFSILGGLVVYLSVGFLFTSARWRSWMIGGLILAALGQVMIGAIQFRDGNNFMLIPFLERFDYGRRASGFYVCPNHFAGAVEVVGLFCLTLACWSRWPVWGKLLVGYAGAVCYAGLCLTGSRGGYLSATVSLSVAGMLTLIALRPAGRMVFWRAAAAGGVLAVLVFAVAIFGMSRSHFLTGRAQNVIDTENIRLDLWRAAIAEWRLRPLIGTGSGTYLYYGRRFRSERVQLDPVEVHNDYLHLLAEYGALGATTFLLFLGAHLWSGVRAFQRLGPRRMARSLRFASNNLALNIGALGAVAAYLVHSVFDFNLHIPANVLLLAFVFGILAAPESERETDETARPFSLGQLILPLLGAVLLAAVVRYAQAEADAERARVALRDEHTLEATRWARRAIALDSRNPETFFYLGESRVRRAEDLVNPLAATAFYRAALAPFQRAWELAPNDETFQIALGRVYDALGRFSEAEWMFGQALAWDPRSSVAQKSYAAHLDLWTKGQRKTELPPMLVCTS